MKFYPIRFLLLLLLFSLLAVKGWGQSITIGTVDPGPYASGSSIAVPITVTGCIPSTTTYTLYISNNINFATKRSIGTFNDFYATFVNGTLPSTGAFSTPGTYYLRVEANSPSVTSSLPVQITTIAGSPVTAGLTTSTLPLNSSYPDVFGNCNPNPINPNYDFQFDNSASTAGATVTANFHDEYTPNGTPDVNVNVSSNEDFIATTYTNYTVFVKATMNGIIGTHAYALINNTANTGFSTTGTAVACKNTVLNFNVDVGSTGLQHNYPGDIYTINWGDGSSQIVTFCDLQSGSFGHEYQNSSCGNIIDGQKNVFKVTFTNSSLYCGTMGVVSTNVQINNPPSSIIDNKATNVFCSGILTFNNTASYPGDDPNAPAGGCRPNAAVKYDWTVRKISDNSIVASAITAFGIAFKPNLLSGSYRVTLQYDNGNPSTSCPVSNDTFDICVQDKPIADFTPSSSLITSFVIHLLLLFIILQFLEILLALYLYINGRLQVQVLLV